MGDVDQVGFVIGQVVQEVALDMGVVVVGAHGVVSIHDVEGQPMDGDVVVGLVHAHGVGGAFHVGLAGEHLDDVTTRLEGPGQGQGVDLGAVDPPGKEHVDGDEDSQLSTSSTVADQSIPTRAKMREQGLSPDSSWRGFPSGSEHLFVNGRDASVDGFPSPAPFSDFPTFLPHGHRFIWMIQQKGQGLDES